MTTLDSLREVFARRHGRDFERLIDTINLRNSGVVLRAQWLHHHATYTHMQERRGALNSQNM